MIFWYLNDFTVNINKKFNVILTKTMIAVFNKTISMYFYQYTKTRPIVYTSDNNIIIIFIIAN